MSHACCLPASAGCLRASLPFYAMHLRVLLLTCARARGGARTHAGRVTTVLYAIAIASEHLQHVNVYTFMPKNKDEVAIEIIARSGSKNFVILIG